MGWPDAHLHLVRVAGVRYGDVEAFPGPLGDEETTTVGDAAAVTRVFRYAYDYGDGWEQDVRIGQRLAGVGRPVGPRASGAARVTGQRVRPGHLRRGATDVLVALHDRHTQLRARLIQAS